MHCGIELGLRRIARGLSSLFFPSTDIPVIALRRPSGGRKRLNFAHTLLSLFIVLLLREGTEFECNPGDRVINVSNAT